MRKFRTVWFFAVVAVAALFGVYLAVQALSQRDGGPVFSFPEGVLEVSIHDGDQALLEGVTAQDGRDGDVTASILVEKISGFYGENRRLVTYAAFDSDDNVTKATREITYTDYTAPRLELKRSLRYRTGETISIAELVGAWDCLDGDLSGKVKVKLESAVSTRTAGVYQIQFSVTNSAGDTQTLDTELEVYDAGLNEATVNLNTYLIYAGDETQDYRSYLESVVAGGVRYSFQEGQNTARGSDGSTLSRDDIQVRSSVDPDTPGVYPVYLIYDQDNYQGSGQLLVVVE